VNSIDDKGRSRLLQLGDVLIVAPYNAQVSDLSHRIQNARVSAVDKFQGQEAPVVIYPLTTSTPEARRAEWNFFKSEPSQCRDVARSGCSDCRCPQPECHSPRQMQLANALCR
jgi:uncharacterized protein